jgi:hypothetical protein
MLRVVNSETILCSWIGRRLRPANFWPSQIEGGLRDSKAVLAVIGPDWLRAGTDEWGQRRIDEKADWVRKELASALGGAKKVIAVLVRGASSRRRCIVPFR